MARETSEETGRTQAQTQALNKVLDKQLKLEKADRSNSIKVAWQRGNVAIRVEKGKGTFGKTDLDEIAAFLNVSRATVSQSKLFCKHLKKAQLTRLCEMKTPPSWHMMQQWAGIKDDKARNALLKDIMSAKVGPSGFDVELRRRVRKGPKKARRPKDGPATFTKLEAEATAMVDHLGWVERATGQIGRMKDEAAQRESKAVIRRTLKAWRATRRELDRAIKKCDKFVKS